MVNLILPHPVFTTDFVPGTLQASFYMTSLQPYEVGYATNNVKAGLEKLSHQRL